MMWIIDILRVQYIDILAIYIGLVTTRYGYTHSDTSTESTEAR